MATMWTMLRGGAVGITVALAVACGSGDDEAATEPAPFSSTVAAEVGSAADLDRFIGLTEAEAEALAQAEGRELRVGRVDDELFALTRDYVPTRVTVEIDDGTVTDVTAG